MPEPELTDHAGLDYALYIRIYLLGLKSVAPIALLAFEVFVPLSSTGQTLDHVKDLTFIDINKLFISDVHAGSLRYSMIFVPFTGKDNHGKCITFGAGLISKEDADSYIWVFEQFKKHMGRHPTMIITDQDLGMKVAVAKYFPGTVHRLCMWHIMEKVCEKLPEHLKKDEEFRDKLNKIVWSDYLEPTEFDVQWNDIMEEYDLLKNSWFTSMFELRHSWIPAYFSNCPMSGLFRTTSLSESENSFFGRYLNIRSNLLEFFMHFDSAIDAQRHAHDRLNNADEFTIPEMKTPLLLEKHAATVYTNKIFLDVQKTIFAACFHCRVVNIKEDAEFLVYEVDDGLYGLFTVRHDLTMKTTSCSCNKFLRLGLLCCHIFVLFKDLRLEAIPNAYIVSRWSKFADLKPTCEIDGDVLEQCIGIEERKGLMSQLFSEFYCCLGLVEGNSELMTKFLIDIREHKENLMSQSSDCATVSSKRKLFEKYYGTVVPEEIVVLPPAHVKTKGSGSRLKSRKEKAERLSQKPLGKCRKCNQMTNNHDSRNCDKVRKCSQV